ncbi:hypothetical protein HS5_22520 [Acidianus sp. HS-5]|nr:hypothetical protein HS5_22520 [Acidianus sp. HS-5]
MNKQDYLILELQHEVGGLFATEEISGINVHIIPPIVNNPNFLEGLKYHEYRPRIRSEKVKYLKEKICSFCDKLPSWLEFNGKMFWIENLGEIISTLSKGKKIINEYPTIIKDKKLITNKGRSVIFDEIHSTISRRNLMKILGFDEPNLKSISAFITILITKGEKDWDLYINGDSGILFSHIIRESVENDIYINYIYSFFTSKLPDIKKVFSDLKRTRLLSREEILAYRSHVIKDAILCGTPSVNVDYVKNCGRLGLWKNISLEEAVNLAHTC